MKILYFDLETTGLDPKKHGIHQFSFSLEVDGNEVKSGNVRVRPFETDEIVKEALEVSGVTEETLWASADYCSPKALYKSLVLLLNTYVDKYDKQDKVFLCGYNSQSFDSQFLRAFFEKNGDKYFGSYFWTVNFDVMVIAGVKLAPIRHTMIDFKLPTVAKGLGIEVNDASLHDAMYDLTLTKQIFKICTGIGA
jgi:DNA polymerase-3 subunit epsilon